MTEIRVLGIDRGKDVCSVVGLKEAEKVLRRRMRRDSVLMLSAEMLSLPSATMPTRRAETINQYRELAMRKSNGSGWQLSHRCIVGLG